MFVFPALTLTFYLLFGANFFLFAWTDNLGLYFVTHGTGFYCHSMTELIYVVIFLRWPNLYSLIMAITYGILGGSLEYLSWVNGVNAARRIDPSWNEHRGMLYPQLFYNRGWVKDDPYPAEPMEDATTIIFL